MTVDSRTRYLTFSLWVLAILVGLAVLTALTGVGVRAWAPGFDLQTILAIASHRDATLTTLAGIVTDAGSFALLAPLSIAFLLLRRWKRPFDDIALLVIAAGSAVLPIVTKVIVVSTGLTRGWRELVIVIAVVIALAVAWSRVYLGVHYPTDVIAGLLLGWGWALLVFHWARPKLASNKSVTIANSPATTDNDCL